MRVTVALLIARLQALPCPPDTEVLVGSWDGSVDVVDSVGLNSDSGPTVGVIGSAGFENNYGGRS